MKYLTGDAIIGCMMFIPISIVTGYGAIRYLMSVERQDMIFNSVKNMLKRLSEDTNLNLINICQKKITELNIMPQNKKKIHGPRKAPIDALRELFEDQQLQINDLTETLKKQNDEIRSLKVKWLAKESLDREIVEKQKAREAEDTSWFWAARTSE